METIFSKYLFDIDMRALHLLHLTFSNWDRSPPVPANLKAPEYSTTKYF